MASSSVRVQFEIGHESSVRNKRTPEGFTHDWEVYVRGADGIDIHHFVDKVVFHLHETFPKPKRVVKSPPYSVKECGYAGFVIPIDVYLKNADEPKKITFQYDLQLQSSGPPIARVAREPRVFQNPSEDFRRKLIKGGGVGIDNPPDAPQAPSRPPEVPKPVKKLKVDLPLSNSFADLFGTPIRRGTPEPKKAQEVKKSDDKKVVVKPKEPEKKDKSKDKVKDQKRPLSPVLPIIGKSKEDGKKEDKKKDEPVKEKERKDKHKDKDKKEKKAKEDEVKKSTPSLEKIPDGDKPEKHRHKHKKKEKEKSRDERHKHKEKKDEPKVEKPRTGGLHTLFNELSNSSLSEDEAPKPVKNSPSEKRKKEERRKDKSPKKRKYDEMDSKRSKTDRSSSQEREREAELAKRLKEDQERREREESEKKQREKDEAERRQREKEDVERRQRERDEVERRQREREEAEKKQREREEAEKRARQREEDDRRLREKEEEDRKQREKDEEDRKVKEEVARKEKEAAETTQKKSKKESRKKHRDKGGTDEAGERTEEYLAQLRELQHRIMSLEDNTELQKIVKVIADSGQYEVTKKTFDFDLCALDQATVRRLQACFSVPT